jgi:hypothetical protein
MIFFADNYQAVPRWAITPEISLVRSHLIASTQIQSIEAFQLYNNDTSGYSNLELEYNGNVSVGGNIRASFFLNRNIELSIGAGYDLKEYSLERFYLRTSVPAASYELIIIDEKQNWMYIPARLTYNIGKGDLLFSFFAGAEYNRLLSAEIFTGRRGGFDLLDANLAKDQDFENLSILELRNKENWSYFFGTGIKYRPPISKRHFFTLNFKYAASRLALNHNIPAYPNTDNALMRQLIFGLGYMDDALKLNYLNISLGYAFTFYKVSEKNTF